MRKRGLIAVGDDLLARELSVCIGDAVQDHVLVAGLVRQDHVLVALSFQATVHPVSTFV